MQSEAIAMWQGQNRMNPVEMLFILFFSEKERNKSTNGILCMLMSSAIGKFRIRYCVLLGVIATTPKAFYFLNFCLE